jgi:hypothetical protein
VRGELELPTESGSRQTQIEKEDAETPPLHEQRQSIRPLRSHPCDGPRTLGSSSPKQQSWNRHDFVQVQAEHACTRGMPWFTRSRPNYPSQPQSSSRTEQSRRSHLVGPWGVVVRLHLPRR